jgi:aspartyl-tRNA(Asn)/glutamyl-tRNA(Gln) amidotransferase subunit C
MISADDVKKLAELSRLSLKEEEMEKLRGEIDSILAYVDVLKTVELPEKPADSPYLDIENIVREDLNPHEAALHTEELLSQAPRREGNFLKVKKILG